jgi:hypothetical protein
MNHNLEDSHMLWKYFKSLGIKKDDRKEDPKEKDGDKDEGCPEIHDCFMRASESASVERSSPYNL